LQLADDGAAVAGRIRVRAGDKVYFSLAYAKADIAVIAPLAKSPMSGSNPP
jgi:hypothetical protein